jgi:hypothetical protein
MLKINIGDIYRIQKSKYDFISSFSPDKILDITFGKYYDFAKSELLLSKGIKEVWSLDMLNNDQYLTIRKLNDKQKIYFQKKDILELKHTKFDMILSFNSFNETYNINSLLKIIQSYLSSNGVAVISILNNNALLNYKNNLNNDEQELLSVDDFKRNLELLFTDISLYSQGYSVQMKKFTQNASTTKSSFVSTKSFIKYNIKKLFKFNPMFQSFYLKYVHFIYAIYKKIRRERKFKINSTQYDIIPYDKQNTPISIIALCKK